MDDETFYRMHVKGQRDPIYYLNNIFSESFEGKFVPGSHLDNWMNILTKYPNTCFLSARKHSKSTTIYSYLMRLIQNHPPNEDLEILYLSYKKDLAQYHTRNVKTYIARNSFFQRAFDEGLEDLTPAESIMKYSWDGGKHTITIEPDGILSFKRGRHPHGVICDDILADPTNLLNTAIIQKINVIFREQVMSLPKEGGWIKVVGTAQDPQDLFFELKNNPSFYWGKYPAITNDKKKLVLWPEFFPWDRLQEIFDFIGPRAAGKEYLCIPSRAAEAYFHPKHITDCVRDLVMWKITDKRESTFQLQEKLKRTSNKKERQKLHIAIKYSYNPIVGFMDIGKKRHPSHIAIFELVKGVAVQRYDLWMDGWEYNKQVKVCQQLCRNFDIDVLGFDNTRGEFESFMENKELPAQMEPYPFSVKFKNSLAAEFDKRVANHTIHIANNQRTINQILCVGNDLDAVESYEGHGETFFTIGGSMLLLAQFPQKKLTTHPMGNMKVGPDLF